MPVASAAQHLISVREVYPGSVAEPGAEFVELQLYAGGQQFVGGHEVRVYDQTGSVTGTYSFTAAVANGQSQRSILIATAAAQTQFGVSADLIAAAPGMSPAGGAACWDSFDCVSWGSFSGSLPSPAGSAAGAIPDGSSLVRSITRAGSQTTPRRLRRQQLQRHRLRSLQHPLATQQRAAPGPQPCDGAGGGPDSDPPQTTIRGRPANRTRDRTPTLRFGSDEPGSRFLCKLDSGSFRSCRSPFTTKRLSFGSHTVRIRAVDRAGNRDRSPAVDTFRVVRG